MVQTLQERVYPRITQPRVSPSPIDGVASIGEELLPIDEVRREEYVLWCAVAEWERADPPQHGSTIWKEQRALYRQCVAALRGYEPIRETNEAVLRPHHDHEVELWAALLHTFVDGLASQIVNTPGEVTAADAGRLLRQFLSVAAKPGPA
ncbi:TetR family transcriptional regulator C-terminal domain-containing protein [Sinosporangium album]|uniref:TetR family transcriptional regulator C-terminal domain-containing protein n=1 Tax=Sinosporangium album TaxID=504805 RepID=UPI0015A1F363|nr:TetR family transcriptional regulator C-terminal domain-containing protein [Sinosporangium album]